LSSSHPQKRPVSDAHQTVLTLLQKRTGLIFPATRLDEIAETMDKAAQALNISLDQYSQNLAYDSIMFDDLCNQVTIAETYFFRDPRQFDFVKEQVIPGWCRSVLNGPKDNKDKSFHVWSAGCSTGEEPYSLAILFDQAGLGDSVQVTATDISKKALAHAAKALYVPWSLRISDQNFCHHYFDQNEGRYQLHKRHSSRVRFAHLNLLDDISSFHKVGLASVDLIFCRNVLIYFDAKAIAEAMTKFYSLLKPGGYLVLGPSDPSANQFADFDLEVCEYGVFFKKHDGLSPRAEALKAYPQVLEHGHSQPAQAKPIVSHRKHQAQVNKLPVPKPLSGTEKLNQAQSAYSHGQYEKAFNLTGTILDDADAAILHIKALANFSGSAPAEKVLKKLLKQHISSFHLQYLHGHLLMDLGHSEAALAALKRCLFLDSKATMAHFSMALVQKRLSDNAGAKRSFRNVINLCKDRPPDEILQYGDGERVKLLAVQAAAELEALTIS
jgi:chemotaxis protein methyltransferase CheR